jgi:hypothetical protein
VTTSTSATKDTTKPILGSLALGAATFKAAKAGGSTSAKKKSKAPTGTKVTFRLSEASAVKFIVERKTKGRRVSGRCKTKTKTNASKPKCTRFVKVDGSFTIAGKAGTNSFTFRGRMGGKALRPGSYRLDSQAADPAKNMSPVKRKAFAIVH